MRLCSAELSSVEGAEAVEGRVKMCSSLTGLTCHWINTTQKRGSCVATEPFETSSEGRTSSPDSRKIVSLGQEGMGCLVTRQDFAEDKL